MTDLQSARAYTPLGRQKAKLRLRRYAQSEICWLLFICLVAAGMTLYAHVTPPVESKLGTKSASMLFIGDVMLARNVETLMEIHGTYYPFKGLRDMFQSHAAVIGNFEASIPRQHVHTPDFGFALSVSPDAAPALSRVGITHMTLANNHTYDYGKEGYDNTREVLSNAGLAVGGNPQSLSADEVLYHTIGDVRVAIIPINAVFGAPTPDRSAKVLAEAAKTSDVQIVSIHWGDEYELVANERQRALAHSLIDAGADAIIGHHPHVVQNIEEYRGAPIFYSLGNCIFDQYWNTAVQEGLAVALSFTEDRAQYTLIPITSIDTRSMPRPMNRVERLQFLDALASRSEQSLMDAVKKGEMIELLSRRTPDNLLDS